MTSDQVKLLISMAKNIKEVQKSITEFFAGVTPENFEEYKELLKQLPVELYEKKHSYAILPNFERKYGEISWYDDLYVERHETVYAVHIIEERFFSDKEKADAFLFECMMTRNLCFEYDW